jgi:hypothetical protein
VRSELSGHWRFLGWSKLDPFVLIEIDCARSWCGGLHGRPCDKAILVRAAGLEPAQVFRPYGFSYHFGFRRRPPGVRGLDYPFTVAFPR